MTGLAMTGNESMVISKLLTTKSTLTKYLILVLELDGQ
jgi:hypothetical protein